MTTVIEQFDSVTPPAAPSGWQLSANALTAARSSAPTPPNVLTSSSPSTVETAISRTPDGGSGNARASVSFLADGGAPEAWVMVRCTTQAWSTLSAYGLALTVNNPTSIANGVALYARSGGSNSSLSGARVGQTAFALGVGYDLQLEATGVAPVQLAGYVRRRTDGLWLDASGAWQPSRIAAVSATVASPLPASGYPGLVLYGFNGAANAALDDFDFREVAAGTYYVSPSGSDAADGLTPATAWRTIAKVNAAVLTPGDAVRFEGGQSFSGAVVIRSSGTRGAPIVIGSYGTGRATIASGNASGVELRDCEYVTVRGLRLTGSGVSTADGSTTNVGAGVDLCSTATSGARLRGCVVDDNVISGYRTGILVRADSGSHPQSSWRGFAGTVIRNNDVSLCSSAGIFTWALTERPAIGTGYFPQLSPNQEIHSDIHVVGNNVYDMYGYNGSTYQTTRSGAGIRICNMKRGLVEYNRVDNCGHMGNTQQSPANFESESADAIVWQFNESSNCRMPGTADGAGFDVFDGGTTNHVVQYNWVHDNDGYGIGGGGVSGFGVYPADGHVVRFNVLANNNKRAVLGDFQFWGGFSNLQVYNNTVYSRQSGSQLIDVVAPVTGSSAFRNNVFVSVDTRPLLRSTQSAANTPAFEGNLYWRGSAGAALGLSVAGTTYATLAAFRGAGFERVDGADAGQVADPLLSAPGTTPTLLPGAYTWTLTSFDTGAGSPARGAALPPVARGLQPGPIDFHAKALNLTALDVGAPQSTVRT